MTIGGLLLATSAGIGYQAVTVMYDMLVVAPAAAATDATAAAVAVSGGLAAEMVSAGDSSSLAGQNFPFMAGLLDVPHVSYLQSAALGVSAVSVLAKEALYHYTLRAGQGAHSDAVKVRPCTAHTHTHLSYIITLYTLFVTHRCRVPPSLISANTTDLQANAWHHRSDAMISLAVLAALVGSLKGFPLLDPLAGAF